jgi:hypothetical protein
MPRSDLADVGFASFVIGPVLDCRPCYAEACNGWECNHPSLMAQVQERLTSLLELQKGPRRDYNEVEMIDRISLGLALVLLSSCFVNFNEDLLHGVKDAAPDAPSADQTLTPDLPQDSDPKDLPLAEVPPPDLPFKDTTPPDVASIDAALADLLQQDSTPKDLPGLDLLKPTGSPCGSSTECQSGHCADKVCCNSSCASTCYTCAQAGSVGTCVLVKAGDDPRNDCAATAVALCGTDGACDGAGACRQYHFGTSCGTSNCVGGDGIKGKLCDGAGQCSNFPAISCSPYMCDTSSASCFNSCKDDSTCFRYKCDLAAGECFSKCTSVSLHCQAGLVCFNSICKP